MQTILHENASPGQNAHGQPIGSPVPDWTPRALPPRTPMKGTRCDVVILDPAAHIDDLWEAFQTDPERQELDVFVRRYAGEPRGAARLPRRAGEE